MTAPTFVRVKDKNTGYHLSVPEAVAKGDNYELLKDHAALDRNGRPLPAKYPPSVVKGDDAATEANKAVAKKETAK